MSKSAIVDFLKQINGPIIIDNNDDNPLSSNLPMKRLSVTMNESKDYKGYSNKDKKLIKRVRDIMVEHNQCDAKYELDLVIDYFDNMSKSCCMTKKHHKRCNVSIAEFMVELELLIPNSFDGKNVYISRINNDIKISVEGLIDIIVKDGYFSEYTITTARAKVIYDDKLIKSFKSLVVNALRRLRKTYDIIDI